MLHHLAVAQLSILENFEFKRFEEVKFEEVRFDRFQSILIIYIWSQTEEIILLSSNSFIPYAHLQARYDSDLPTK